MTDTEQTKPSRIPKFANRQEEAELWDTHDLSDYWDKTKPVDFDIDISSEVTYYPVEADLSERIASIAKRKGVSAETLLNLWLEERVRKEGKRPAA